MKCLKAVSPSPPTPHTMYWFSLSGSRAKSQTASPVTEGYNNAMKTNRMQYLMPYHISREKMRERVEAATEREIERVEESERERV